MGKRALFPRAGAALPRIASHQRIVQPGVLPPQGEAARASGSEGSGAEEVGQGESGAGESSARGGVRL